MSDSNPPKVGISRNHFFDGIVPEVADAIENAITRLARNGAGISEFTVPELYYGLGALSLPCGVDGKDLPIGLQVALAPPPAPRAASCPIGEKL